MERVVTAVESLMSDWRALAGVADVVRDDGLGADLADGGCLDSGVVVSVSGWLAEPAGADESVQVGRWSVTLSAEVHGVEEDRLADVATTLLMAAEEREWVCMSVALDAPGRVSLVLARSC